MIIPHLSFFLYNTVIRISRDNFSNYHLPVYRFLSLIQQQNNQEWPTHTHTLCTWVHECPYTTTLSKYMYTAHNNCKYICSHMVSEYLWTLTHYTPEYMSTTKPSKISHTSELSCPNILIHYFHLKQCTQRERCNRKISGSRERALMNYTNSRNDIMIYVQILTFTQQKIYWKQTENGKRKQEQLKRWAR